MVAKRQHFIPRLHLQHFSGQEPKGHVWTYDAQTGQVRSAVPEQTAVESHFYSIENDDGTMNTEIEEKLAKIESNAASTYEDLLKHVIPQETQARADFAAFLAIMYVRTPAMRRMSAEMISRGAQILNYAYGINEKAFDSLSRRVAATGGPMLSPEQRDRLRRDMIDPTNYIIEVPRERTLHILGASEKLSHILFGMKWSLAFPMHGFFITTDNPLVREVAQQSRHPIYGDHGFLNKTAEVLFPLSPQLLLLLSWQKDALKIGGFDRAAVDRANRVLAAHSDRYLYSHIKHRWLQRLAEEFKDTRPEMTTQGFGPQAFAPMRMSRRSNKTKR
jgi:hypothetical protein